MITLEKQTPVAVDFIIDMNIFFRDRASFVCFCKRWIKISTFFILCGVYMLYLP